MAAPTAFMVQKPLRCTAQGLHVKIGVTAVSFYFFVLQLSKPSVLGYSVPLSTYLELSHNMFFKVPGKHRAGDISSTVPSALSSWPHLPSRRGVDSQQLPESCMGPTDGVDECYYCYC